MLTKADVLKGLEPYKFAVGKPVIVHSSIKAIGRVESAEWLLDILIEFFTKNGGLLCVPTHTWASDVYDMREHYSNLGLLPCTAAAHPDAVRTDHPTHSMAVFGERAKEFANGDGDTDTPASPNGCLGKLYDMGGYVLLLGVNNNKNTFIHFVEEKLKVKNRLTDYKVERTVILQDGTVVKKHLYWFDDSVCDDVSANFFKFEPAFYHHGIVTDSQIGGAKTQLLAARDIFSVIEDIYNKSGGKELLADSKPLFEELYK